jgi:hypothetical protein
VRENIFSADRPKSKKTKSKEARSSRPHNMNRDLKVSVQSLTPLQAYIYEYYYNFLLEERNNSTASNYIPAGARTHLDCLIQTCGQDTVTEKQIKEQLLSYTFDRNGYQRFRRQAQKMNAMLRAANTSGFTVPMKNSTMSAPIADLTTVTPEIRKKLHSAPYLHATFNHSAPGNAGTFQMSALRILLSSFTYIEDIEMNWDDDAAIRTSEMVITITDRKYCKEGGVDKYCVVC